ncbi:MAG TPA: glycosyl hydrolase family 8 [Opitutus sp.]|nr:glycosyl hydrolase family 8 [Opitutus sp.]
MIPRLFLLLVALSAAPFAALANGRNLFAELLGQSESATDAKINAAFAQLFHGDPENASIYFPVGDDMAYIGDIGNGDVRSEGMSYGMMIAVQLDRRAEFDRLWKWARTHMYHATGPRRGYFAWQCAFDGRPLDPGSASDGEEWFATALFFAAHRWGRTSSAAGGRVPSPGNPPASATTPVDYASEAQSLLRAMLHHPREDNITPIFDRARHQVVFAPTGDGSKFTDPSYHLPAFYELWARWAADPADRAFWSAAAKESRAFFQRAANPRTGLMPEYAHFDGTPVNRGGRGDFRFDAWRTPANVALDHAWWSADPWAVAECNRVLRFFASQGPAIANQFTLDGKPLSTDTSAGMLAMAAVAGLAADPALAKPFVQRLWDMPIPSGHWRYYDGLLYQLALLECSGRFRIFGPVVP